MCVCVYGEREEKERERDLISVAMGRMQALDISVLYNQQ